MTSTDLEAVIARTGHERFRWLVSDANPDAAQRDGYRRIVRELAAGPPSPAVPSPAPAAEPSARPLLPLTVARRTLAIGHGNCLYATRCGCSGGGAFCHHLKRVVSLHDCVDCLTSTGILRPE